MRGAATSGNGDFSARVIAGTHTILLALNCKDARRKSLMGFSIQREIVGAGGAGGGAKWLRSLKVFKAIVPDPKNARDPQDPSKPARFYTEDYPVQSFLWGDYGASPGKTHKFRILPRYGKPGALTTDPKDEITLSITTEAEWPAGAKHGVWFNRGAIASQKFAEEFGNKAPKDINDPKDPEVAWLSRGLLEACLSYINETKAGDALRVAAYEFTYPPILNALKALIDKGIDVKIVYHDTTAEDKEPNETAMTAAGLPLDDQKTTFKRSKTKIPHNKFIVRLKNGTDPVEVWTGSTNFTPSGFLGQTNVGHRIADTDTAKAYFNFWKIVKGDPDIDTARGDVMTLTPDPPAVIAANSTVRLFSPRTGSKMLGWYGQRMLDAVNSAWFTAAFGVTEKLVAPLTTPRAQMRFVLMEKPPTAKLKQELMKDFAHVIPSYGVPLGEIYTMKDGKPTTRKRIQGFELDKWFFAEELYRPKNDGFVFFVHTKFLLIDPLSDDPLVCSGSANFSPGSLTANDENMLLIRGDKRVADIYMTEFDRIFRHFYFRDIANELAGKGDDEAARFLTDSDLWTAPYFDGKNRKNNRRLMFFATEFATWAGNAAKAGAAASAGKSTPKRKKAAKTTTTTKKAKKKKAVTKKAARKKAVKKKKTKTATRRKKKTRL